MTEDPKISTNYFQTYYFIFDGSSILSAYSELINILKAIDINLLNNISSLNEAKMNKIVFLKTDHENFIEKLILIKNFTAYIKEIGKLIHEETFEFNLSLDTNFNMLKNNIKKINWDTWIQNYNSFKVRLITIGNFVKNSKYSKNEYYSLIPQLGEIILRQSNATVDVKDPFHKIDFIIWDSGKIVFGLNIFTINRTIIDKRAPKHRKFFHPSSMNPFLIRNMMNFGLTNEIIEKLSKKASLYFLDPFMGGGGMLVDALDLGFHTIGIDLKYWMGRGTRMNLYDFEEKISFSSMPWNIISLTTSQNLPIRKNSIDLIVTDPPYGISTSLKDNNFSQLLTTVLSECFRVLKKGKRIVISIPSEYPLPKIVDKNQIIFSISNIVHRSLTRIIWVIENK
ncbi:MAG: tRNA (guanine(10)-N2)-dimethyltransferase [Candidatus Heimdallarchaeota archaeon LC_3]|nr:MAG: tRNA (guanine(10)-N2)-dimethyltransferase [Candidatus Heimdallarchaeota archaeon LC_3]